jgi:CIC family chloride channel protein
MQTRISEILDRLSPPVGLLLLLMSVAIGAGTGFAAVVFIKLIAAIQNLGYTVLPELLPVLGTWVYLIVPVIGGLLVGPLILFAQEAKGHGVPEVMQALIVRGGRIRARVAAAKIAASALCIGTGGSAGREGPIVQVGSALGSSLGQILRLSDDRIRNLVGCGAAAGIAATFNAPIAGVVFAIEVLMGNLQVRSFGNVVIAAVSSSIVSRLMLGAEPAFSVPIYRLESPTELIFYLLLGILSALVGIMFIRMLNRAEIVFDNWSFPQIYKPAIGAVLLGIIGMGFMYLPAAHHSPMPFMYGSGFEFIEEVVQGGGSFYLLLLLVFLKPLATSFTLGSGNSGGVFAPSLFIGAMLGGCLGILFEQYLPDITGSAGAYALVGMAALFAATARAPLTAMLIVFEMSNDYHMILPLMVATITASYFAQWLHPESIYTIKLAKRGIRFFEGRDMDVMQGVKVEEVMRTRFVSINKDRSVAELMALFQETNLLGFPVVTGENSLWGIITLQDVHRSQALDSFNPREMKVADLATEGPIAVYPDEPVWVAIQKMSPRDLARLPVVARDGSMRLVGMISRSDVLRAYDVGVVRKQRGRLEDQQTTLRSSQGTGFVECVLNEEDPCCYSQVKDLALPPHVNLVSIKREGNIIVPRGRHQLEPGDVLTMFGRLEEMKNLKKVLNSRPATAG